MLHAANAVSHSYKRTLIIANDTDIIVLGISFFSDIAADKLWVSFGIGNNLQDKTTYASFLAPERNVLTQNGARGQSSQPRFVV